MLLVHVVTEEGYAMRPCCDRGGLGYESIL